MLDATTDPSLSGFLFIGDPHLTSITPGRRTDVIFADTVLDKLAQAGQLANSHKLQAVILGDLFDRAKDGQLRMLSRLVKVLQTFDRLPICLIGNHDRAETTLAEGTALELVHAAGAVDLLTEEQPYSFNLHGVRVMLHGVPHGKPLPAEVAAMPGGSLNVLVTHHDMAFDRAYPGAIDLPEIANVPVAINGHMHLSRPPVDKGATRWHNPGNITRMSLDCKDQIPRVWAWYPANPQDLVPLDLQYVPDILNLVGRQVDATEFAEQSDGSWESEFASLLKDTSRLDAPKTDDATLLLEDLEDIYSLRDVTPGVKTILASLLQNRLDTNLPEAVLPPELAR